MANGDSIDSSSQPNGENPGKKRARNEIDQGDLEVQGFGVGGLGKKRRQEKRAEGWEIEEEGEEEGGGEASNSDSIFDIFEQTSIQEGGRPGWLVD
eukprot:1148855-Amorphochlora_amoeboformis.AAC.1